MPLHKDDPRSVGGYKLVDRLGAGGMGAVYRGRSRSGREVAVKVVHAQYAEDAVFRTRFRQEIEAVRKVSGAFTAPVVDADPDAARPWMATQYVPGSSLAQRIRDRGALRGGELRQLALGLVEALRDIHRAGVVHRDLKPANVLMAEGGPRVIDFGISRAAENHNTLTETGQMIGTPPFMSPEQLTDARTVGPASDVFSLGALLVYATTGRGPFDTDSPYLTAYRVVHDEPVLDGVGQPLRGILERCLAKEATQRPGLDELAREFATALPEPDAGDLATVSLRLQELPATPDTHLGTLADATVGTGTGTGTGTGRRSRRVRPLLAATGTVGALALGLTAYLMLGPGWAESGGGTASRWSAPPSGWKPWETTVFKTAPLGVKQALGAQEGLLSGEPDCLLHEDAVYCVGESILPVRLDARTGRTVWRAEVAPSRIGSGMYSASLLGVQDGTLLLRQSISSEAAETDPVDVFALDVETGAERWHRRVNDADLELVLSGDIVLTSETGREATARSPRTGAERWTARLPAGYYCSFMTAGDGLYANCSPAEADQKTARLLEVDRTDGSVRTLNTPATSGILGALDDRLLLMEMDAEDLTYTRILLVDPKTGARTSTKLAEEYGDNVTLADSTLWFTESDGQVTAVSARTGKELWKTSTSLEQPGEARYDPRAGALYMASASGRVAALDGRRGTVLWETLPRTKAEVSGLYQPEVLLHEGALVVFTPNGTVFSLDPAHPERKPAAG
ncbi:protein kinase [Streptomyces sp. NBC_01373]|uniref:protein kinase domain-containing protein n=1 Tax=Streptomyces sp. NBC_01373 TaxID=2903843 RepID=UPI00225555C0|nr:protein kinase [Streptomyces sp. NBC_01373]MCX4701433.1 protein kinase [Streptomyces sp. NBC_01373]